MISPSGNRDPTKGDSRDADQAVGGETFAVRTSGQRAVEGQHVRNFLLFWMCI